MGEDIDIKLVILGEGNIGKTSIINKFLDNEIPDKYIPTIGYKINHKEYILGNKKIRINIWDCCGKKAFNEVNPAVYNNIDGAFLVFDLSRTEETLKNLKKDHVNHLDYYWKEEEGILFFIGNKLDLVLVNKDLEHVKNYLSEDDLIIAVSALTGENVNECFELLVYTVLKQTNRNEVAEEFIQFIGKTEGELISQVIDIANIDILLLKEKVKHLEK